MKRITDFKAGQKKIPAEALQGIGVEAKRIQQIQPGTNYRKTRGGVVYWTNRKVVRTPAAAASGVVQQFRITDANFPDTILAEPWDGTAATGEAVHVARPPLIRIGRLTTPGFQLNGASFSIAGNSSFAAGSIIATQVSLPTYTESWTIGPSYVTLGSTPPVFIYAATVDHTGVSVGGEEVQLLDLNVDGRQWLLTLPGTIPFVRSKFFIAVGRVG